MLLIASHAIDVHREVFRVYSYMSDGFSELLFLRESPPGKNAFREKRGSDISLPLSSLFISIFISISLSRSLRKLEKHVHFFFLALSLSDLEIFSLILMTPEKITILHAI